MSRQNAEQNVFPAGLLVAQRPCLVVGGGPIAVRKAGHLLDAGARVRVVAPEVSPRLREWASHGRLVLLPRPYRATDMEGVYLAFACTGNPDVNRQVIRDARAANALVSSIDASWPDGDFVTPAIHRRAEQIVTVSTSGASCRRARLVKDHVGRHLDLLDRLDLLALNLPQGVPAKGLAVLLRQVWGIHEFLLVPHTAPAVLLAVVSPGPGLESILRSILGGEPASWRYGFDAFRYSMALCDQLDETVGDDACRQAAREATQNGWAGVLIERWMKQVGQLAADKDKQADKEGYEELIRNLESGSAQQSACEDPDTTGA